MSGNFYRIVLIPPQEVGDKLTHLSQQLCGKQKNYTIGINSVPHATICSFEGTEAEAASIWQQLQLLSSPPSVSTNYFYSVVQQKTGNIYHALGMPLSEDLMAFQQDVVKIVGAKAQGETGRTYRPHYTLGLLRLEEDINVSLQAVSQPIAPHKCVLGIGLSVPEGQVSKIIFSNSPEQRP